MGVTIVTLLVNQPVERVHKVTPSMRQGVTIVTLPIQPASTHHPIMSAHSHLPHMMDGILL